MSKAEVRKIIHIDMDAFYASVEQRDHPELRGKPVAVGGSSGRGVIAAASYEARAFGVRSAMPSRLALRKCPTLLFVRPTFEKYKQVSKEINAIFSRYTPIIEPLSLDEAFLDVTFSKYEMPSATYIAQQIKNDIRNELGLIASAGVSYNKFLAKIASDQDKPDGLFVITPEDGAEFIKALPIEDFFGVGKVTAEKMKANNIFKGSDLLPYSKWELQQIFGKTGGFLYDIARGEDHRKVQSERVRKSVGAEMTFSQNVSTPVEINERFTQVFEKWWERYEAHGRKGRTVTLKIRNHEFETITRSFTDTKYVVDKRNVRKHLDQLLYESISPGVALRLIGVSISSFESDTEQQELKQLALW
ncbi:DNA polymerase IV [Brumimicrobium salinarum]|uniref:DNA polymerase IV n=1 Tax=Brumimicrobium salinarum TaxID=2058658 RepID=A0A2I0R1W2_9FLAO|nr:DNA polymerase IV [Brumimicrobium salinarum]PKR80578.1 DNA polymerase IV [Brumimicrobium salinarum]